MPLYEYQCTACGHRFEVIRKWSDPPQETCPKCGGPVHKLQSAPAFQFKGTGWYVTDYAKKDQGGPTKPADGSSEKKSAPDTAERAEKTEKSDKTDSNKSSSSGDTSSSSNAAKSS